MSEVGVLVRRVDFPPVRLTKLTKEVVRSVSSAAAIAEATEVLPTPASPSRKSGRCSLSARNSDTASARSAM